jgi:hypothetical protein
MCRPRSRDVRPAEAEKPEGHNQQSGDTKKGLGKKPGKEKARLFLSRKITENTLVTPNTLPISSTTKKEGV